MLFHLLLVTGLATAKPESCPGDTQRYECGTMCELKCGQPRPELCAQGCVIDACQCPPGMWRTASDKCLPMEDDCFFQIGDSDPKVPLPPSLPTPQCPGDTVWDECPSPCESKCGEDRPKWCKALQKVINRYSDAICAPADCVCPEGLSRTPDDMCIDKRICDKALSCPGDTKFYSCGSMCEGICGEETPGVCALGCEPDVCQCPPGTKRTPDDHCVTSEEQCPTPISMPVSPAPICPGETVFMSCGTECEGKCGQKTPEVCADVCVEDVCQCPFGTLRTLDNRCVEAEEDCGPVGPMCPGDTVFMECGSMCEGKCGEETPELCATGCVTDVCQCPHGTYRTEEDRCLRTQDECIPVPPAEREVCPGETVFQECGTSCEAKCGEPIPELCIALCVEDVCQCPMGTIRTADDRCVKSVEQCVDSPPEISEREARCPGDTVFMECGSMCEGICGVKTPEVCGLACVENECQCPAGTLRTRDDRCVATQDECGPVGPMCPGETVYMECGSMCEGKCGEPIPEFCPLACVPDSCQCPRGTLRTKDNRCVKSEDQCKPKPPAPVCPGDTIFMECGSMCEGKCGEDTPDFCGLACVPDVCQCPLGYFRTKDDRCVKTQDECQPKCPGETQFMKCGSLCEDKCGAPTPMTCPTMCVEDVCQCPFGTKRTPDDRCVEDEDDCAVQCPGETQFFECGTMCEKTCGGENTDVCNYMCNVNVCQCPSGMFRTKDDQCLKSERQCPKPEKPDSKCPGETQFFECGTMCENKCGEPAVEKCNKKCNVDVCQCPPGMFRTVDDRCVFERQCPPPALEECPGDLEFFECGTMCENKCGEPAVEVCNKMCKTDVCQCPDGLFRTEDNRCVAELQCPIPVPPRVCPGQTQFFECGTMCENKCGEPAVGACNFMCNVNVCQCPHGYFRTEDHMCVEEAECPVKSKPVCPGDTLFYECGRHCENKCGEPEVGGCIQSCKPNVCQCPRGHFRTVDDKCVSQQDKCPGPCPGDLVRQPCGTPCQKRCGLFGAEEDPVFCKSLNDIIGKFPGQLCTEGVCQCPPGQLRTDGDRCVDSCPSPSNPYPTFEDFQSACSNASGSDCSSMGCGWAASGQSCPVPAKASNIKCNQISGEDCWKVGCKTFVGKKSGKLLCKGKSKKWSRRK